MSASPMLRRSAASGGNDMICRLAAGGKMQQAAGGKNATVEAASKLTTVGLWGCGAANKRRQQQTEGKT